MNGDRPCTRGRNTCRNSSTPSASRSGSTGHVGAHGGSRVEVVHEHLLGHPAQPERAGVLGAGGRPVPAGLLGVQPVQGRHQVVQRGPGERHRVGPLGPGLGPAGGLRRAAPPRSSTKRSTPATWSSRSVVVQPGQPGTAAVRSWAQAADEPAPVHDGRGGPGAGVRVAHGPILPRRARWRQRGATAAQATVSSPRRPPAGAAQHRPPVGGERGAGGRPALPRPVRRRGQRPGPVQGGDQVVHPLPGDVAVDQHLGQPLGQGRRAVQAAPGARPG